jgi:signal transduction histidine kinase
VTFKDGFDWTRLLSDLADRQRRSSEAVKLAQSLGALDFIILLPDSEVAVLRPAPGFRQTLAGGSTWAELLARCDRQGSFEAIVAHPNVEHLETADVFVAPDGSVFILIGGKSSICASEIAAAAGLLLALLRSEAREDAALASARSAGDATRRANALASSLDQARGEVARNARALREALSNAARLNDDLRLLNETLELRVREETAERSKAQDALRQAQKMEAIGHLTGGVAHDFNNLLTPIIGSLDMLVRRQVGSERERRLVDGALQSAERAKTLVQRLLAFARRQPLQPAAVDLKQLVQDMEQLMSTTMGAAVEVRVQIPNGLPPVTADANQLEMALLNLAVNARDAMPDGGQLILSAAVDSASSGNLSRLGDGHYVKLSVSDSGVGMDEATLSRAIEPFFSTKAVGDGTGLGLSMVHGLALQQHGDFRLTSSPGRGTTATLWLPVSGELAAAAAPIRDIDEPKRDCGTALLVDDEDLVRMSTAHMLMDLGYSVVEAVSAEEALRLIDGGLCPDLVVTDHVMPGMSGAQLARKLSSEEPDLPVLIVSGYSEADEIELGLHRLSKPFRQAELAASVLALKT